MSAVSGTTKYAVFCPEHGRVFLSEEEYDFQMDRPDSRWTCPRECGPPDVGICGADSEFDDETYEGEIPAGKGTP
jgi:hypothetical protein